MGTCCGKSTIGPRGRGVEKAPRSDFTFTFSYALCISNCIAYGDNRISVNRLEMRLEFNYRLGQTALM
jgi:hypothetical protein